MYQKNELVVYENAGVCEITDIKEMRFSGSEKKTYYLLRPLRRGGTIYTPVDNPKVTIRPVISKAEALEILKQIPDAEVHSFEGMRNAELEARYKELAKTHHVKDLILLEMGIYRKCRAARRAGKKISELDDRYMKQLKDLVEGELSVALGIPNDEVPDFIAVHTGRKED